MLDDDPNEEAQRQFRAQVDEDVANWLSQLDSDVGSGVPPPPQIKVTEVSSQPYEFDLLQPGSQNAATAPGGGTTPAPCPDCPADSVSVDLSGINLCSGCIVLGGIGEGLSVIISGGSIDGSYELTAIGSPEGVCCYQGSFATGMTVDIYTDGGCSVFFLSEGLTLNIWAGRTAGPDCKWSIFAWLQGDAIISELAVFLGVPQSSFATAFNNALACGGGNDTFVHPCDVREWEGVGGEDGTATLS